MKEEKVMHVFSRGKDYKKMLELLKDRDVEQMLFDALHKRRTKYSKADNSGSHAEYKEMMEEMKKDYKKHLNNKL